LRIVESAVSQPVLFAVGLVLSLLAFQNTSFAQNPLFVEKTGANNPLLGLDVGTRSTPVFVDIDGDGDLDAFAGGADGLFKYYKRTPKVASPFYQYTEQFGANNPMNGLDAGVNSAPAFADLDGDGDFDCLSGNSLGGFLYYENTGTPAIASFVLRTGLNNPMDAFDAGTSSTPVLVDLDDDGDFDCISGESGGTFKYYENIGTSEDPQFAEQTGASNPMNGFDAGNNSCPAVVDINNDDDLDVFSGNSSGNYKCYQNNGTASNPNFAEQLLAPVPPFRNNPLRPDATFDKGSNSVLFFVDLDNDGDMDAVSGENQGVFYYFENQASNCPPVIACIPNLTVQVDDNQATANGVRTVTQAEYVTTGPRTCGTNTTNPWEVTLSGNELDCADIGTTQTVVATIRDLYNGFVKTCATQVTLQDNVAPNAFCVGTFPVYLDETGYALSPSPEDLDDGSTDNCNNDLLNTGNPYGLTFSYNEVPGFFDCSNVGTLSVTLFVTDAHNNTSTCVANIAIIDNLPPVVSEGQPDQVIGNCGPIEPEYTPYAEDNCSSFETESLHASWTLDELPTEPGDVATYELTWTFTDANNNPTVFIQTLHVVDDMPPTLTCPPSAVITSNPFYCGEYVEFNLPTTPDCNYDYMIGSASSGDFFPIGKTIVSFIAYDLDGNTGTCGFSVTVEEDDPPFMNFCDEEELNIDGTPLDIEVSADEDACSALVWIEIPYIYDNCDESPTLTIEFDNQGVTRVVSANDLNTCDNSLHQYSFPIGTTTVTMIAKDASGNHSSTAYTVTVTDAQAPVLTCPDFITVNNASGQCSQNVPLGLPEATDLCSAQVSVVRVDPADHSTPVSGNTFSVGNSLVEFLATDAGGNTATCAYLVQVFDNEKPVLTCPSLVTVNAPSGQCTTTATWTVTVSDNCGVSTTTPSHIPNSTLFNEGVTTVVYSAQDAAGNTATCAFSVNVYNNVAPSVGCPSNVTISLLGNVCYGNYSGAAATPSATAGCDAGTVSYYNGLSLIGDLTNLQSYQFPLGVTTVTARTTDFSGSTSTCAFTVTVKDLTAPVITGAVCNTTITVTTGPNCSALVSWIPPTATDNCTAQGNLVQTQTHTPNASFPTGTTTVIYTFKDASNNTSFCNFQVVVKDLTPPVPNCPASITENTAPGLCSAVVTWQISANDACSNPVTLNPSIAPGSTFPKGTTTVTYTATDSSPASNSSTCSFTVTVVDNQNPVITGCPNSATYTDITDSDCSLAVNWTAPTASDNCPGVTMVGTKQPGALFADGTTTTVTYTATDAAGRTATCTFNITVLDNTNPTIICPTAISTPATNANCSATITNLGTPTASDNCPPYLSLTNNAPANSIYAGPGNTTVVWTVTDRSGRTATCAQTITVSGSATPVLACPNPVTVNTAPNSCSVSNTAFNLGTPTPSNGACGGGTIVGQPTNNAPVTYQTGTTTVTWNANFTGNTSASCTQVVTVNDGQNPTINCPGPLTVNAGAGICSYSGSLGTATASDNCGLQNGSPTFSPAGPYSVGTTTVVYTATDLSGRTATCAQTVTVVDNQNPSFVTCPANTTVAANQNNCTSFLGTTGTPSVTDNCGIQGTTFSPASPYPVGATVVTYKTTDVNGRTATCTQTVTVTGSTPTLTCPANQTVTATANCSVPAANVALGTPTPGGCAAQIGNATNSAPSSYNLGLTTVVWTASFTGNTTATCAQTVTVMDNQNPTITCPANITLTCPGSASLGSATTADNCSVASVTNNGLGTYPQGTTTVVWTVMDSGGRTNTCAQTVTVTGSGGNNFSQIVQKVATDGASGDGYGVSVAISGDYAVVGSYLDDSPMNGGSAYILERNLGSPNNWGERKRLVAQLPSFSSDALSNDRFGENVAIDGDWAVVAAPEKNNARGAVYIFNKDQGGLNNWGIVSKLTAPVGDEADMDRFGSAVSISGIYVIVGAKGDDNGAITNQGAAYIYERSGVPGTYSFSLVSTKRLATDGTFFDEYGTAVSINGNWAVVGAPKRDDVGLNSNNGVAYILFKDQGGVNNWGQVKKIAALDAGANDNFGMAIAMAGTNVLVGAPMHDEETGSPTVDNGAAYIFSQNAGGPNNWGQVAKLLASDRASTDQLGGSVALYSNTAVVGAKQNDSGAQTNNGAAYIFDGSSAWSQAAKLLATAPVSLTNDNFGQSVGVGSAGVIVGSYRDDIGAVTDQGSVYFFNGGGCGNFAGGAEDREEPSALATEAGVRLFPNPTSDILNIDVTLAEEAEVNISVTDAAGRVVSSVFSGIAAPAARYQWDGSQVPTGIYFVRVEGAGLRKVMPVSVIR